LVLPLCTETKTSTTPAEEFLAVGVVAPVCGAGTAAASVDADAPDAAEKGEEEGGDYDCDYDGAVGFRLGFVCVGGVGASGDGAVYSVDACWGCGDGLGCGCRCRCCCREGENALGGVEFDTGGVTSVFVE
jgi:hypothetical protein